MTRADKLQVEESRRLLRAILNRREFVAAAGIGALGLAGCGSAATTTGTTPPPPPPSPPGTIPSGFTSVTGTVSLPAGSALKPSDLKVDVLAQTASIDATAAFTIGITSDGPALALLVDATGNGVLMSLFDSGLTPHVISSHTTAVALVFYGTGGYLLPTAAQSQVLGLLNSDPAMAAVDAAIAHAVAADPYAVANGAATIAPAIQQALNTMVGPSLRSSSLNPPSRVPAASLHNSAVPTLMTLNSVSEQNGVVVSMDTVAVTLLVSNTKRRRCKAYVYEVTTQTGNAKPTELIPAVLVQGPIDLDATQNLGVGTGLVAIAHGLNGAAPWTPVNLPPIPVTLAPATADQTTYQLIVLSASPKYPSGTLLEPAFFRDAHFANEVEKWRADTKALFAATVLGDIVMPTVCLFTGLGAIWLSREAMAVEMTNAATLGSEAFTNIINTLQYGSLGKLEDGLAQVVQNAVKSTTAGNLPDWWPTKVKTVVSQARGAAQAIEAAPTFGSRLASGAKMFSRIFEPIFAAGLILDGIDFGRMIFDFFESDLGANWEVLLRKQKLGLLPQNPRVTAGDPIPVHFTVSNPVNLPAGSYEYDWTQSSLFSTLSAVGEVNVGNAITTSKLAVDLRTTGSDKDPVTVLVIGYDKSSGQRVEIGRAGTTVNFLYPAQILPSSGAAMDRGEQRLYSVVVDGVLPNGIQYKWTLTGNAGSIGGSGVVTTAVPQINYTANQQGVDGLHVDIVDQSGTLWAKADAAITVAKDSGIRFVIAGPWDFAKTPPAGTYVYNDFLGGRGTYGTDAGNLDALFLDYNFGSGVIGVLVGMFVAPGGAFTQGQTFSKVPASTFPVPGQFNILLAVNQADPSAVNSLQLNPIGPGTCRIDTLGFFANGKFYAEYSFNISNGGGGTIIGSGVARW